MMCYTVFSSTIFLISFLTFVLNYVLNAKSPCKSRLFRDEARHGKALKGLLERYYK